MLFWVVRSSLVGPVRPPSGPDSSSVTTLYMLPAPVVSLLVAIWVIRSTAPQCLCSSNPCSRLVLSHNADIIHLTSSPHSGLISHDHKKGEYSTKRYFEKRDHIHITFCIVCCYNCCTLLSVIVHLLLFLLYKINFITVYVCIIEKNMLYIGFGPICSLRHLSAEGSWNVSHVSKGGWL